MLDELKPHDYIIALDVIAGLVLWIKLRPLYMRWLVVLLITTLFVKLATPLGIFQFRSNNYLMYNIFTPLQYLLFACLYYKAADKPGVKNMIIITVLIVIAFSIINPIFIQKPLSFHSYTFVLSCIALSILASRQLLRLYAPGAVLRFYKHPMFWVSVGLLSFWPANILTTGLIQEFYVWRPQTAVSLYKFNDKLNIFMYGAFLLALIASVAGQEHRSTDEQ